MGNHFLDEYGAWKPFPEPLPPPLVDPRDTPWLILKFNEAWRPYIAGCLSSLARPETYEDVLDNFIREDIDNGGELPWLIERFPQFYNWRFVHDPSGSGDSDIIVTNILRAPGLDGCWGTEFIVASHCPEYCNNGFTQITGIGQQNEDPFDLGFGGHIVQMNGYLWDTVVGNTWDVEVTDCQDTTAVEFFGGQNFTKYDFSMKHFQVSALGAFYLTILLDRDWECGPV